MKLFLFLVFSFTVLGGCSSSLTQEGSRIRVEFRSQEVREYRLLAVRESSLLVTTDSAKEVIPIDAIHRAFAENNAKTTCAIIGGLIGLTVTVGVAGIIIPKEEGGEGPHSAQALLANNGILLAFPPMIIGAIIGYLLANDEDELDPSDPEQRQELREFAAYPRGEPPDLYEIR